jgi:plasmid stabilization system protein ParE
LGDELATKSGRGSDQSAHPQVIFYRVRDEAVEIVRVLDGRRDLDATFIFDRGEQ